MYSQSMSMFLFLQKNVPKCLFIAVAAGDEITVALLYDKLPVYLSCAVWSLMQFCMISICKCASFIVLFTISPSLQASVISSAGSHL